MSNEEKVLLTSSTLPRANVERLHLPLPASLSRFLQTPLYGLSALALLYLMVYLIIELCLRAVFSLPLDVYASGFVVAEALTHFGWTSRILLVLFTLAVLICDRAKLRWSDFSGGASLRVAMVVLAVSMAWPLSTYGYNFAVDSTHVIDRVLVLITCALFVWRPVFVFPFLLVAFVVFAQLTAPSLGGSVVPHKTQVLRALELFAAFYLVRALFDVHRTDAFVYVLGCFVAASYWLPAWAKIELAWLSNNQLNMVPLGAFAHGWRGEQPVGDIVSIVHSLEAIAPWLQLFTLVVEAAFILLFLSRRLAIALLMAVMLFHVGVFYLFGFLFWTWIILDLVLLALLLRRSDEPLLPPFGIAVTPLACLLILAGPYWAKPPALAWYDTPLSYTYAVEATMSTGERVRLSPTFFAPYEDAFTMVGFSYLSPGHGLLVGPYGVTQNDDIRRGLDRAKTWDEVLALEAELGYAGYDAPRAERFYAFVERFVRARNRNGDRQQWLHRLHPPRQFWSKTGGRDCLGSALIHNIRVIERSHFYDGHTLRLRREVVLRDIPMADDP